ncbi:hypothetical protein, partial [Thiolapillus sp.]|uniref:hypothetical protein n=1 Tax=Thiolapillus sp. TaxID=2017437 RepID=UPI003AF75FD0
EEPGNCPAFSWVNLPLTCVICSLYGAFLGTKVFLAILATSHTGYKPVLLCAETSMNTPVYFFTDFSSHGP